MSGGEVRRLGQAGPRPFRPGFLQIQALTHRLGSKIEDMDRAGDIAGTFNPVTLGPEEIRTAHHVLTIFLRTPEYVIAEVRRVMGEEAGDET